MYLQLNGERDVLHPRLERLERARDQLRPARVVHVHERPDDDAAAIDQERGGIAIDLAEVDLVDRGAVNLLALSEQGGVELRNCPPYIQQWIARERERP